MTLRIITEADVQAALSAAELEAYRGQTAAGQPDPLPAILEAVTDEVRGYAARQANLTGDGVPISLLNSAMDIAIYRLAKRCQMSSEQQRKAAADDAYERLASVAKGEIAVDSDISQPGEATVGAGAWGSATPIMARA